MVVLSGVVSKVCQGMEDLYRTKVLRVEGSVAAREALTEAEKLLLGQHGLKFHFGDYVITDGSTKTIFNGKKQLKGNIALENKSGGFLTVLKKVVADSLSSGFEGLVKPKQKLGVTHEVHFNPENPGLMTKITERLTQEQKKITPGINFKTEVSYDKDGNLKNLVIEDPHPLEYNYYNYGSKVEKKWYDPKEGKLHWEIFKKQPDSELTTYMKIK